MQVHKILVATMLAAGAAGAMSQELDPGETLQAKNLAAPRLRFTSAATPRLSSVIADVRDTPPSVQAAAGSAPAPATAWASRHGTRAYAQRWLHGDKRAARGAVVGEAG